MGNDDYIGKLRGDCSKCFGLCCVALYFSASEGFPADKEPGQACPHLQADSRCGVYSELPRRGLRGCMAFDCFGAGQQVCQTSFAGADWHRAPEMAPDMFTAFLVMRQLHEMLWYLNDALQQLSAQPIHCKLQGMREETEALTKLPVADLLRLNVDAHRQRVNTLLLQTSELVRGAITGAMKVKAGKKLRRGALLMGNDLRKSDLRGANLRGACLIAADLRGTDLAGTDLIGADFRDADVRGADLSQSLFLTQAQVNVARGDNTTRLPEGLDYPRGWADQAN